jgi:hypothetical protein
VDHPFVSCPRDQPATVTQQQQQSDINDLTNPRKYRARRSGQTALRQLERKIRRLRLKYANFIYERNDGLSHP